MSEQDGREQDSDATEVVWRPEYVDCNTVMVPEERSTRLSVSEWLKEAEC